MSQPNIGEIVSTTWEAVLNAEPEIVYLVTKDGRWFAAWTRVLGSRIEYWAEYKSGVMRRGTFEFVLETYRNRRIYHQRKGVGQPRFQIMCPMAWIPMKQATDKRMATIKPPKDIFTSKSFLSLLR
jgi:hypothetical protein